MDGGAGRATSPPSRPTSPAARAAASGSRCADHRARGDGHDRLFRFESIEGSAFDDTLIGNKQAQRDRRRPRQRHAHRRRRRATRSTAARAATAARGPRAARSPAARKRRRRPPPTSSSTRPPAAAAACRSSAAAAPTTSPSPSTPSARASAVTGGEGARGRPRLHAAGPAPTRSSCAAGGPARWLMADLGPGNDSFRVEGSLAAVEQRPDRRRPRQRHHPRRPRGRPDRGRPRRRPPLRRRRLRRPDRQPARARPTSTAKTNGDLLAAGGGCAGGEDRRRPGPRRRLLRRDPGPPRPALHLLPQAQGLDRRGQGLPPGPPRPLRRGHGGLLRQRRPDRRLAPQRDARPARRQDGSTATAATT